MAIALAGGSEENQAAAGASQLSSSSSSSTTAATTTTPTIITTAIPTVPIANVTDPKRDVLPCNSSGVEMLGGCSVCSDDQGSEENPLVYCDGCDLSVHQACYGIVRVPPGNWFCKKCECRDTQKEIKCELCPAQDGALKKTETGLWAHVVCALYIPEVRFGNNNTMEPIIIKHIQADRYSKNCYLCEENNNSTDASYGAVMDCHKPSCKQSFHVTCAQAEGLLCEEAGQGSDNLIYCGYCKHHFRKLKAGNRKTSNSLNNSSSSYLDSASDSSQDIDSRCNTKEHLDKSRANKLMTIQPTSLPINDVTTTNNNSSNTAATAVTTSTNSSVANSNSKHDSTKNAPISLTLTLNSTFSNSNTNSTASTAHLSTSQKKRRAPKSSPSGSSNNSATLLAAPGTASSYHQPSTALASASTINIAAQDVYNWSDKDPITNNNNINSNNNNTSNNNKSSKKKPTSNTQSASSSKLAPTAALSGSSLTNYCPQKVGSPNLSLSTSSSLTSPANSTKSTSNSSTTTVTASSSSSSSTVSNSPSPSLLSPNIPCRGSTVRQESPLASNSKTGNNSQGNRQESVTSNNTLPIGTAGQQARLNYADPKIEPKKSSTSSTSLLSTTVPMPLDTDPAPSSSTRNLTRHESIPPTKPNSNTTPTTGNLQFNESFSDDHSKSIVSSETTNSSNTNTQQPTVPPLIIPVPQLAQHLGSKQPTSKSKSGTKSTSNSRKKSTETNEASKPEAPKPKPSRSKTKPTTNNNNNVSDSSNVAKVSETKSKGKSKSPAAKLPATASNSASLDDATTSKTPTAVSTASKRKSRSASNTTETSVAPSPAKRSRKKKSDAPVNTPEKPPSNAGLNQSSNVTNQPPNLMPTSNGFIGTGPLMINTPVVGNRLMQGMSSLDSQDMGNRYGFSPMISPYANFDHLTAPSLSRSSLSRLFTTSLTDPGYQVGMAEDPAKAFDELRENTWSHLSKCVLDQAQQFDIPSLIGTLYTLRSENEKLFNKVRDLKMKRDELLAMNARLDLPGPLLTQHLNNTSPNFSSVVSGLTNSPKNLPTPSPGSGINKQALVSVGPYNHLPPGSLGPPNYVDRSSPLVGQTYSGLSNIKSSSISTPSPPIGALMAHSGSSNRAGLITVNPPYLSSTYPPPMNSLGPSPQGSSYYPRQ